MKINVKVITHASRDALEKLREGEYKVWVRAIPEKGKANEAVCKLLAQEFEVSVSRVKVVSGLTSMRKVIEVFDNLSR